MDPKGLNSIKGKWLRKPYVENINVDGLLSGIEMSKNFNPTPETATLLHLNFTVSGDVGFTAYCQEFDDCGEEIRYWHVSKKFGVSKKMRVPIKVHQKPWLMRATDLEVYLKENFSWTAILMEHAKNVNSMISETPTKICKMFQK